MAQAKRTRKKTAGRGRGRRKRRGARKRPRRWLRAALIAAVVVVAAGGLWLLHLRSTLTTAFEGRLWAEPTHAWSAETVLYPGCPESRTDVESRLERSGYRQVSRRPAYPGEWRRQGRHVDVRLRPFRGGGLDLAARSARLGWDAAGRLASIDDLDTGRRLATLTLEPEEIATFFGDAHEDRTILPLDEFPEELVRAVLAAEDARFYEHRGVDARALARAVWSNLRGEGAMQGGSTLTQQTVKNLWLSPDRTLRRKMREAIMAVLLEGTQEKDKILEVYLNEIYLGQRGTVAVCGFGEAARFYFGKDVRRLTLAESATLAAMIPSPGRYSPFADPDLARARRDALIDRLEGLGWVPDAEADAARLAPVETASGSRRFTGAPYFADLLRHELRSRYDDRALTTDGLGVRTTLDTRLQSAAEDALRAVLPRLEKRAGEEAGHLEAAMVVTRPQTGEILALVGGRDFLASPYNRAVSAKRQPGSLFKPFVYAAGFETGRLGPDTTLLDEPLTLESGGETWSPRNHDGTFRGPVRARAALEQSLNVPTARAALETGLEAVARTAEAAGLPGPLRPLPSLALGAQEVTVVSMAEAYGTLANHGQRVPLTGIRAVVRPDGEVLESRPLRVRPAVSPQAAALVLDAMVGVVRRGTGRRLAGLGVNGTVAGKTGTSDDGRDSWFVGITPEVLALVWVGRDDNGPTRLYGSTGALEVFADFARRAGVGQEERLFPLPPGVVRRAIDPDTGGLAVRGCPATVREAVLESSEPPPCPWHARSVRWKRASP